MFYTFSLIYTHGGYYFNAVLETYVDAANWTFYNITPCSRLVRKSCYLHWVWTEVVKIEDVPVDVFPEWQVHEFFFTVIGVYINVLSCLCINGADMLYDYGFVIGFNPHHDTCNRCSDWYYDSHALNSEIITTVIGTFLPAFLLSYGCCFHQLFFTFL